jgi:glycosyltransferase involved in cell wall biosynthesis
MLKKLPLTLAVITFNEQNHIERCLRSVPFASEMIVIDSFSNDRTCEIAQKLGAQVIQKKWPGFGLQKREAVAHSKYEWILSLDADEALSPELAEEILNLWPTINPEVGYALPRSSFFLGRWIKYGGWTPDYQLRLFNKKYSNWNSAPIHEKVICSQMKTLSSPILHWVFEDLSDQIKTNDRYSSLQAQERHQRGEKFSIIKLLIKPWVKFFETYIFKRGFKDGWAGFYISVNAAYSVYMRIAKMWELERIHRSQEN